MKYKNKDLLKAVEDGEVNVIAHQCNTCCGMSSGIAKLIANKYPIAKYLDRGFRQGNNVIGRCLLIEAHVTIFNLYGQKNVNYAIETFDQRIKWLKSAISEMVNYLDEDDKIGIPLLASGLASNPKLKGNMSDLEYFENYIAPEIEPLFEGLNVTVYYI